MASNNEKGGYDIEFVDNEPNDVTCCICLFVLREPMQAEQCGHRFCKSCVEDLKDSDSEFITCPQDRVSNKVFRDRGKEREILDYLIKCTNVSDGCQWTGELRDLEKHKESCEYRLIPCGNEGCREEIHMKYFLQHMVIECSLKSVDCEYCKMEVKFCHLEEHNKVCEKIPMECNRCETKDIPKHLMKRHLKKECPMIDCEYSDIGCQETVKRECISDHRENSTETHLDCVISKLREQEKLFQTLETKFRKQEKQFQAQLQKKEKKLQQQQNELDRQSTTIKKLKEQLEEQQSTTNGLQVQMSEILGKLDSIELSQDAHKLQVDSIKLSQDAQQQQLNENQKLKKSQEGMLQDVKDLQSTVAFTVGRLDNLQPPVEAFRNELVWVIDKFNKRLNGAKRGNNTCSQIFFTQKGYKCKVLLYLNGLNEGLDTHISLYLGLEEGPFDDSLVWPMNATISFCVLKNGLEKKQLFFTTASSNQAKQAFGRPQPSSCGLGFQHFIPHNSISNFIVNNTLTLKISVQ